MRSAFIVMFLGLLTSAASAATPCAGDLNGDAVVDGADLGLLLASWDTCPDCAADLDGNGVVDGADLGLLLAAWGDLPTFDFGPAYANTMAHQIGLELLGPDGPLALPQEIYDRIVQDIAAITAEEPSLAGQGHTMAWAPNQLIVAVQNNADNADYECLNDFYEVTNVQQLFVSGGSTWFVLTFAGKLNVEALATIYEALPEVTVAEPNGLIGGQNFWMPDDNGAGPDGVWTWTIDDGFLDCFDGCDCHKVYTFDTTPRPPGEATLIDYQQFGQSWCDF